MNERTTAVISAAGLAAVAWASGADAGAMLSLALLAAAALLPGHKQPERFPPVYPPVQTTAYTGKTTRLGETQR